MTSSMPWFFETHDLLHSSLDGLSVSFQVDEKGQLKKFGRVTLNGRKITIRFEEEAQLDSNGKYGRHLVISKSSDLGRVIEKLEDKIGQISPARPTQVVKKAKVDKDFIFLPMSETCMVRERVRANDDEERVVSSEENIPRGSLHTGFLEISWLYRSLQGQSLRCTVVATKFSPPAVPAYLAYL